MAKSQKAQSPAAQEQTAAPSGAPQYPMQYDVKIYPVKTEGALRANATVNINGAFAVRNIKVMEGSKGLFVSMPSYKAGNGEYKDICFPCTKESKLAFDRAVLDAYQQTLTQGQAAAQKQEAPDPFAQPEQGSGPKMTM